MKVMMVVMDLPSLDPAETHRRGRSEHYLFGQLRGFKQGLHIGLHIGLHMEILGIHGFFGIFLDF